MIGAEAYTSGDAHSDGIESDDESGACDIGEVVDLRLLAVTTGITVRLT